MAWTDPVNFAEPQIVDETDLNLMQDNIRESWHEVAYVEFTADVTSTAVEATATDIVSSGALTYVANPIIIEFFTVEAFSPVTGAINLWDASTDLGRLTNAGAWGTGPLHLVKRLTPTAASHTYKIRCWSASGTITVRAGAGGAGVKMPGFIRVMQKGGA
jgi:hypothetical protein